MNTPGLSVPSKGVSATKDHEDLSTPLVQDLNGVGAAQPSAAVREDKGIGSTQGKSNPVTKQKGHLQGCAQDRSANRPETLNLAGNNEKENILPKRERKMTAKTAESKQQG